MKLRNLVALAALAVAGALILPAAASAHARISPPVTVSKALQLFSLAVPTEKNNLTTTKIVLTVPSGFGIDSFAPSPGWQMSTQQSGSGNNAVITQVTWTGGKTPTGEDSLFQFLASTDRNKTYTFKVDQTYSDGSIVSWAGPESSDHPSPTIETKSSLGGSSSSVLSIIALIVGVLGLAAGGYAVTTSGSRGRARSLT